MVLVDYGKCTGCRTCEAVCSSHNRPVTINSEELPALGIPAILTSGSNVSTPRWMSRTYAPCAPIRPALRRARLSRTPKPAGAPSTGMKRLTPSATMPSGASAVGVAPKPALRKEPG
jgi:ferredoxin